MRKPVRSLALLSASVLALGLATNGGSAAAVGTPEVLAKHIAGPLSLAVADDGSAYVTADFGGQLLHVVPGQAPTVVYQSAEQGAEVGAVSASGKRVVFTVSGKAKKVYEMVNGGAPRVIANVGKYEKTVNPDKHNRYGFRGLSASCIAQLPKDPGAEVRPYNGRIDSHPYSSDQVGDLTYIGEAAGNDILSINPAGKIRTVAVLPPTTIRATKARVAASHLPVCVTGHKFNLEPVPTDVEVGPDGWLYVSSLPGGPEDGSLGANGRVYKVNPETGTVKLVAKGFLGTVDVAVADNGDVYVAQLFSGVISRVKAGSHTAKTFVKVPMPGAIEWTPGFLYASEDALVGAPTGPPRAAKPGGKVVRIPWS